MGEGEYTHAPEAAAGSSQIGIYSLSSDEDSLFVTSWTKVRSPGLL